MNLSRTQCSILKGLAILSIALHNFIHQTRFGFAQQNESSFNIDNTINFFQGLNEGVWNALLQISSFLGWIGVPVFVFLSGYGLVKKYESSSDIVKTGHYICHSWAKLFCMMLPGILFFAVFMQLSGYGGFHVQIKYAAYLSMLGNLFGLYELTPGVYWYFGLTFELYLIYLLYNRYRNNSLIVLGLSIPILIQAFLLLLGKTTWATFNLKNALGWLPIFVTGLYFARRKKDLEKTGMLTIAIGLIFSSCLLIICNANVWMWLFIHFFALAFFIFLMLIIEKIDFLESFFSFLGKYSGAIFVCHPIARIIAKNISHNWGIGWELLLYLALIPLTVLIFQVVYKWLYFNINDRIERSLNSLRK